MEMLDPDGRKQSSHPCCDSVPNPFIAFRQQVDTSIATLLRSFTGLPSPPPLPRDSQAQAAYSLPEAYQPHELEQRYPGTEWARAWRDLVTGSRSVKDGEEEHVTGEHFGRCQWQGRDRHVGNSQMMRRQRDSTEDDGERHAMDGMQSDGQLERLWGFQALEKVLDELAPHFKEVFKAYREEEDNETGRNHNSPIVPLGLPFPSDQNVTPETELDMYREILHRQQQLQQAAAAKQNDHDVPKMAQQDSQAQSMGIVAQLTTTQRTVDADGKMQTRVVLKKRFADGREESCETTHESLSGAFGMAPQLSTSSVPTQPSSAERSTSGKSARGVGGSGGQKEAKNTGGWFWS